MKFKTLVLSTLLLSNICFAGRETDGGDTSKIRFNLEMDQKRLFITTSLKNELLKLTKAIKLQMIEDESLKQDIARMVFGDGAGNNLEEDIKQSIYQLHGVCLDGEGNERSASASLYDFGGEVCFSLPRLIQDNVSTEELIGLAMHEHAHHFGLKDEDHKIGSYFAKTYLESKKVSTTAPASSDSRSIRTLSDRWWSAVSHTRHHTMLTLVGMSKVSGKRETQKAIYDNPNLLKMSKITSSGSSAVLFADRFINYLVEVLSWEFKPESDRSTVTKAIEELAKHGSSKNVKDLAKVVYDNMEFRNRNDKKEKPKRLVTIYASGVVLDILEKFNYSSIDREKFHHNDYYRYGQFKTSVAFEKLLEEINSYGTNSSQASEVVKERFFVLLDRLAVDMYGTKEDSYRQRKRIFFNGIQDYKDLPYSEFVSDIIDYLYPRLKK